ncbi:MAG TPA: DUF6600 domain-containing protein [Thermoanaerobaculia bacterium]
MKTLRTVLLALLLGSFAGAALAQTSVSAGIHVGPSGRASVDLGFFYDDLASYGNWIQRPSYGWVWTPRSVSSGWRPYQDGHWVWTDQGWTWVTDEPYGWATYHYGRWYADPELGWVWVPGDQWGPAWVSWQEGTDYIGWAPLPPSVTVSYGGVLSVSLAPAAYVFVPERYFLAPRITTYAVPRERVVSVYRETRNITVYRQVNNYVYNTGVPVDRIQRVAGRPVQRYRIADATSARGTRVQGNQVTIFRPQVQRANVPPPPQRPAARRAVVDAAQFQQSHPERAARRAEAQGTGAPGAQPAPRPGPQPRTVPIPTEEKQPAAHPRSHGKVQQPEVPPPGRQHQVQPPPEQTERQHPPRQEKPPVQDQEKRQPHNPPPPPPEHQQRQVEPQQHHQQPPPPQQQQKKQQQEKKKEKEKEQEERKPPQR